MVSNLKQKEQKYKFVELLIPTFSLLATSSYIFYWKGIIMNNHQKIVNLHVVLLPHEL